jgi:hypothetical protein
LGKWPLARNPGRSHTSMKLFWPQLMEQVTIAITGILAT